MSVEENKALVRRLYEAINEQNLEVFDELVAHEVLDHSALPETAPGREGMKQWLTMVLTAFPDWHETLEDLIGEGDRVVSRVTARGTHRGEFVGIPATGKQVTVAAVEIFRVDAGRLVEHWDCVDQLGMMQQLGVIPATGEQG